MISKKHSVGQFLVVEIWDEFTIIADLQELDIFVDGLVNRGHLYIAVRFDKISYIYSGALGVLVKNINKMKDRGGEICLLEPNADVNTVLETANLDKVIRVFHSEQELLEAQE